MRDEQEILGLWQVKFRQWTWDYRFSENKTVTWRDIFNKQTGSGQWVMTNQLINIRWYGSKTNESWYRPINADNQEGWIDASYGVGKFQAKRLDKVEPGDVSFDFRVSPVPTILQGFAPVCWAAGVSMMLAWRNKRPAMTIEQAMALMGEPYITIYRNRQKLNQQTFLDAAPSLEGINVRNHYATASGLKYEPLRSYSPKQLYELMVRHRSPLLVEAYWDSQWTHVYVVKRISGSMAPRNTLITVNDPNSGEEDMAYTEFMTKVEGIADRVDIQVWHY
jgi:papain like cysteine protease AvrRpt2